MIYWCLVTKIHLFTTSPLHATHQSSIYNTPVKYIQHTSPVHTNRHVSPNQVSQQEQLHYWQRRGSTRLKMTPIPSVIRLDGTASLLLWRAMGTRVLKPDRLSPIWPQACQKPKITFVMSNLSTTNSLQH